MLDKASRKFLAYLESQPGGKISLLQSIDAPDGIQEAWQLMTLLEFLEHREYVKIIRARGTNNATGVQITHKGRMRKEYRRQEVLRYFVDKWVDFFAMLIALISLVVTVLCR